MSKCQGQLQIRRTEEFAAWLSGLRDRQGRAKILARIDRLGPGYRVYYVQRGEVTMVLLCGGDKSTQDSDIKYAKILASQLEDMG